MKENKCGSCNYCCKVGYLLLSEKEYKKLKKIKKFKAKKGYMLSLNKGCPFLIKNECSVYKFRPQDCKEFACRKLISQKIKQNKDKK